MSTKKIVPQNPIVWTEEDPRIVLVDFSLYSKNNEEIDQHIDTHYYLSEIFDEAERKYDKLGEVILQVRKDGKIGITNPMSVNLFRKKVFELTDNWDVELKKLKEEYLTLLKKSTLPEDL